MEKILLQRRLKHFESFKNNELKNVKKICYRFLWYRNDFECNFSKFNFFDIKMVEGFSMKSSDMIKIAESVINMDKDKLKKMRCVNLVIIFY